MEPEPELISGEEKKEERKSERFIATTSSYKRKKLKTCFQLKRSALIILDSSAVEHPAVNRRVVGSNPTRGAFRGIVQSVERWSPKPNVEGSSPSAPVLKIYIWLSSSVG